MVFVNVTSFLLLLLVVYRFGKSERFYGIGFCVSFSELSRGFERGESCSLIMDVVSSCPELVSVLLFCDVVCHMNLSKVRTV